MSGGARTTGWQYGLLWGLIALLGLALIYPILLTVRGGFADDVATGRGFTFRHLVAVFQDPVLVRGLLNSLKIAATTTVMAIVVALPLAVLAARYRYPFKGVWSAVVLVPLILPPFVGRSGRGRYWGGPGRSMRFWGRSGTFWGRRSSGGLRRFRRFRCIRSSI
jgi:iron(III) transport system permease protein